MRKRNWHQYNRQLVQRGSVTFLIDLKVVQSTDNQSEKRSRGRPQQFSDQVILMLMMMKVPYRFTYRMLEGFARSIQTAAPVPTYSWICKRAASLQSALPKLSKRRPSVVILDASGVKVTGEGEWKVRIHGKSRARKWLKVHIAIDAKTQEIVAEITTDSGRRDGKLTGPLLDQVKGRIEAVMADGAYDERSARAKVRARGAKALIPPPKNGRLTGDPGRDEALRIIHGAGGDQTARSIWGKLTGYSRRSLVETTFSRLKGLFGARLFSKSMEKQRLEIRLRCFILNKMLARTT